MLICLTLPLKGSPQVIPMHKMLQRGNPKIKKHEANFHFV